MAAIRARARARLLPALALLACSCGGAYAAEPELVDPPEMWLPRPRPEPTASVDAGTEELPVLSDLPRSIEVRVLHREHRAIPGVMFGGWGPHLGHLLRQKTGGQETLYFADDACAPGACDVNANGRIDYLRLGATGWARVDSLSLPAGIQQNTASILSGDRVLSYGVDSGARRLVECSRDLATGAKGCASVPIDVGAAANYVGAAISPRGHRMAWLTNVKDGGGGSFSFLVDYGGGWNGPRQGAAGGYNDSSYVNVAFGVDGDPDRFSMFAELVSGVAPAWTFTGGVGEGSVTSEVPVIWATPLVPPPGDAVISPDDVLVEPRTSDTHLLARTKNGSAAYYFRPKGGAYSGPLAVFPKAGRARLVSLADGSLVLVRSDDGQGGIVVHVVAETAIHAGSPVSWAKAQVLRPMLPPGYQQIYAIYTESTAYSLAPRTTLELALVGAAREHEVLHVSIGH